MPTADNALNVDVADTGFIVVDVAVAVAAPKADVAVPFIGNGEPSKPTFASSNALVFNVKRENAMTA